MVPVGTEALVEAIDSSILSPYGRLLILVVVSKWAAIVGGLEPIDS